MKNNSPIAVLISDVHYSLSTLELADKAFRMAIDRAAELKVDLYDLGDLTNDKANLRGEVINRLIETMDYAAEKQVKITLLIGNHSLINEKSKEHTLHFLDNKRISNLFVCDAIQNIHNKFTVRLIPYQSDYKLATELFNHTPLPAFIFAHQGLTGAIPGHYTMDHSAVHKSDFKSSLTVFSGHYHNGQTINLPNGGSWTYIGNPYTLTFGEANDTPKGFMVLYQDGSFDRIPCNLRKHVVIERNIGKLKDSIPNLNSEDLLWLKVKGTAEELAVVDKDELGKFHLGHTNYRFEKIIEQNQNVISEISGPPKKDIDLLKDLINNISETEQFKLELINLAQELLNGNI